MVSHGETVTRSRCMTSITCIGGSPDLHTHYYGPLKNFQIEIGQLERWSISSKWRIKNIYPSDWDFISHLFMLIFVAGPRTAAKNRHRLPVRHSGTGVECSSASERCNL